MNSLNQLAIDTFCFSSCKSDAYDFAGKKINFTTIIAIVIYTMNYLLFIMTSCKIHQTNITCIYQSVATNRRTSEQPKD